MERSGAASLPRDAGGAWIRDAVVYQIFVDRFANGDPRLDPANVVPWGSEPTATGFMGGDLKGIAEKLPYLEDLGVNVVCLTPIFMSSSNHRYNTYDYYRVDPRLGTIDDFRNLLAEAHRREIRILLDGVFNHCGRGFYPFFDVMENGTESAFSRWFSIEGYPVDAYGVPRFRAWLGAAALPEFNLGNPEARGYLLRVADFWTRVGVDGWRLDAVPHVLYPDFWSDLCRVIKNANPAAYLLGEIWEDPSAWLEAGHFDGATNYPFRELVIQFVIRRSIRASEFAGRLACLVRQRPWGTTLSMCNLLGSHDTSRIGTLARGDLARIKQAFLLLFCFPGIPSLYYGDEIGLEGGKDPENRRAMPWDPGCWNQELRGFIRQLVAMRRSLKPLQHGDWRTILTDDGRALCVFLRRCAEDTALLLIHNGDGEESLTLDLRVCGLPERCFVDHLSKKRHQPRGRLLSIELGPRSGALLTPVNDPDEAEGTQIGLPATESKVTRRSARSGSQFRSRRHYARRSAGGPAPSDLQLPIVPDHRAPSHPPGDPPGKGQVSRT